MTEFSKEKKVRDPYRIIYCSSLDRGLAHLLIIWPDIKKEVPEANLHIFYGWQTYDAIFRGNPERQNWKAQMSKMMTQNGIEYHGRVGQKELVEEFMKAGIFAYPTDFTEISCINSMQAQIYGAIPVVTNYAALKETVCCGGIKLDIDITSLEGKGVYKKELISLLKDHKRQEEIRKSMMECAQDRFLWSKVAKQWIDLFNKEKIGVVNLLA